MRGGQRTVLSQRIVLRQQIATGLKLSAQGLDQPPNAAVLITVHRGHTDTLTDRQQLIGAPAHGLVERLTPVGLAQLPRLDLATGLFDALKLGRATRAENAARHLDLFAEQLCLGPVEARHIALVRITQGTLGQQQDLIIEHHTGCAHQGRRRRTVTTNPTAQQQRQAGFPDQLLGQDVAGVFTNPAARLVTFGDQSVDHINKTLGHGRMGNLCQQPVLRRILAQGSGK